MHGNWLLWFRPEWRHSVTWGDNAAPVVFEDNGELRLAPRESFEKWTQEVEARSRPWQAAEVAAVRNRRSALGRFLLSRAEQLARVNASLAATNAELDSFAYAAAHDLKEPLRGVYSRATFLAEDYADILDDEGRDRLESLLRLSARMSGLLDSLMEYATLGHSEFELGPVALADAVADAADLLSARLQETGATLIVHEGLPVVQADRNRLVELLSNVISNASKDNDHGAARIEISVCRLSDTRAGRTRVPIAVDSETDPIVICVADDGIGVPLVHQEEICSLVSHFDRKLIGEAGDLKQPDGAVLGRTNRDGRDAVELFAGTDERSQTR